jgi:hypothetical protein
MITPIMLLFELDRSDADGLVICRPRQYQSWVRQVLVALFEPAISPHPSLDQT